MINVQLQNLSLRYVDAIIMDCRRIKFRPMHMQGLRRWFFDRVGGSLKTRSKGPLWLSLKKTHNNNKTSLIFHDQQKGTRDFKGKWRVYLILENAFLKELFQNPSWTWYIKGALAKIFIKEILCLKVKDRLEFVKHLLFQKHFLWHAS